MITSNKTNLKIENLTKIYRLGQINYSTFLNELSENFLNLFRKKKNYLNRSLNNTIYFTNNKKTTYAKVLNNINFKLKKGQALAILGKNGAGKTTLLKCIARIAYPTSGKIELNGKVAPLLNVGDTINPELTGLENIFFIGAMYGMTKLEIEKELENIINFAEINQFVNTPLKRYSTGMNARLAFSIIIHAKIDLFLADEILTVGDQKFKEKCAKKISSLIKNKQSSLILVSHERSLIEKICNVGIVLNNGNCSKIMNIKKALQKYHNN